MSTRPHHAGSWSEMCREETPGRFRPTCIRASVGAMNAKRTHPSDPRGLIGEAFVIDGITAADCRAIFFDWALGLGAGEDPAGAAAALLAHHTDAPEDHPMRELLREAMASPATGLTRRRGRRRRNGV